MSFAHKRAFNSFMKPFFEYTYLFIAAVLFVAVFIEFEKRLFCSKKSVYASCMDHCSSFSPVFILVPCKYFSALINELATILL